MMTNEEKIRKYREDIKNIFREISDIEDVLIKEEPLIKEAMREVDIKNPDDIRQEISRALSYLGYFAARASAASLFLRQNKGKAYFRGLAEYGKSTDARMYAEKELAIHFAVKELYDLLVKFLSVKIPALQTLLNSYEIESRVDQETFSENNSTDSDSVDDFIDF